MMRALEFAAFGFIATGLHVAAAVQWTGTTPGDARPAAAGAFEAVVLTPADATLRERVKEWETPPRAQDAAVRTVPTPLAVPAVDRAVTVPAVPLVAPETAALPTAPASVNPVSQPDRAAEFRPRERPDDLRIARAEPAAAVSGAAGREAAPAPQSSRVGGDAALESTHAEAVRDALARARSYPARARDRGIVGRPVLAIELDRSGRLLSVALARSSGSEVLDRASLDAARRARFPAAPSDLKRDNFSFQVGIAYALD